MSSSLSDQTTAGTAVTGPPAGFTLDTSNVLPGNTINLTYTDSATNTQHQVSIVRVDDPSALPLPNAANANPQVIGVNFSGGMASVVSQLNAALGRQRLQFSNPSGSTLQRRQAPAAARPSMRHRPPPRLRRWPAAARNCHCLPTEVRFTPAPSPPAVRRLTGLAGRITVNPAVVANPSSLTVYSTSPATAAGDTTRSDFLYSQLTSGTFSYSPQTGLGSASSPFNGTITSYHAAVPQPAGQCVHDGDAVAAGPGRRRQHAAAEIQLHVWRQHRHRNVEPDRAAEFLCRQCSRDVGRPEHDDDPVCRPNCKAISDGDQQHRRLRQHPFSASPC